MNELNDAMRHHEERNYICKYISAREGKRNGIKCHVPDVRIYINDEQGITMYHTVAYMENNESWYKDIRIEVINGNLHDAMFNIAKQVEKLFDEVAEKHNASTYN